MPARRTVTARYIEDTTSPVGAAVTTFLHAPSPALALVMVSAVVALVAWALQLMQAANDRGEFGLMLAGCMVCSAAVGLATVMVLSVTGPDRLAAQGYAPGGAPAGYRADSAGVSLDSISLPWDNGLDAAR